MAKSAKLTTAQKNLAKACIKGLFTSHITNIYLGRDVSARVLFDAVEQAEMTFWALTGKEQPEIMSSAEVVLFFINAAKEYKAEKKAFYADTFLSLVATDIVRD